MKKLIIIIIITIIIEVIKLQSYSYLIKNHIMIVFCLNIFGNKNKVLNIFTKKSCNRILANNNDDNNNNNNNNNNNDLNLNN